MESVQKEQASSSRSWVLRNTFIEFVEDGADEFASCLMRASSDSVLYEGYSRTQVTELLEPPEANVASTFASDEPMSDTDTVPDTNGGKPLPLLCYSHIDSGVSTPNAAQEGSDFEQYVTRTPSLRGMDWQSRFEAADLIPRDEEIRSDPMPDLVPPIHHHSRTTGGRSAPSKQDLRRLAAEVARLEQENNLLRRMAQGPKQEPVASPSQQIGGTAWAMASAVDFTQHQDSRNAWLEVCGRRAWGRGCGDVRAIKCTRRLLEQQGLMAHSRNTVDLYCSPQQSLRMAAATQGSIEQPLVSPLVIVENLGHEPKPSGPSLA